MALTRDLVVDQGTNFSANVTANVNGAVLDLTNYTANASFKHWYTSNCPHVFTVSIPQPNNGIIVLSLAPSDTANVYPDRYVWDVKVTSNTGVVTRIQQGILTLTPEVSL